MAVVLGQGEHGPAQQFIADPGSAHRLGDADLRDVAHICRDQAAERDAGEAPGLRVEGDERSGLEEAAAAGVLDDVVEEAAGADGDRYWSLISLSTWPW